MNVRFTPKSGHCTYLFDYFVRAGEQGRPLTYKRLRLFFPHRQVQLRHVGAIRCASSRVSNLTSRAQFPVGAGCTSGRTASEPGGPLRYPHKSADLFLLYEAQIADNGEQPLSNGRFGIAGKIKKRIKFILVRFHLRYNSFWNFLFALRG